MKTLFIASFQAHISRNILAAPVLGLLQAQKNLRIVILAPDYKVGYFTQRFAAPNIRIEGVRLYQGSRTKPGLWFKRLGMMLFDTPTARAKKKYQYWCEGKYAYYFLGMLAGFLGRSFVLRRIMRELDYLCSPKGFFKHLFETYRPAAVFSTDVQNENDVSLMQEARNRGVPTIGMIRSWDNPTQRILRVFPERLMVGSQTLQEEVEKIYHYPASRITITGNPHYDLYLKGPSRSREQFFSELGLNPHKRLILYAPFGNLLIRHNDVDQHLMEILAQTGEQVLIRFPPDEDVRLPGFVKPPQMVYDRPGVAFKSSEFGDREISPEDDQRLIDSLVYADVVVSGPTSIPLDAALMDRPAIMVHFYPTPRGFCGSVFNYWFSHIHKFLETGGVVYARSKGELLDAIQRLFENPHTNREGRAKIRAMWFSHADGKAAARLAKEILTFTGV